MLKYLTKVHDSCSVVHKYSIHLKLEQILMLLPGKSLCRAKVRCRVKGMPGPKFCKWSKWVIEHSPQLSFFNLMASCGLYSSIYITIHSLIKYLGCLKSSFLPPPACSTAMPTLPEPSVLTSKVYHRQGIRSMHHNNFTTWLLLILGFDLVLLASLTNVESGPLFAKVWFAVYHLSSLCHLSYSAAVSQL